MTQNLPTKSPVSILKSILSNESIQSQFKNALKDKASLFIASLTDLYASNTYLQSCEPKAVIVEALKAATLNLPINKNLGYSWIVPYKNKGKLEPDFQIGYKGYIQLAIRTGQYKYINADMVYEGETIEVEKLSGKIKMSGDPSNQNVIGYFSYFETINGYQKAIYWTKERMELHGKTYSQSWKSDIKKGTKLSNWVKDFDKMGLKTIIKEILSKWGILSIEMSKAFENDSDDMSFNHHEQEAAVEANAEVIDTKPLNTNKKGETKKPDF